MLANIIGLNHLIWHTRDEMEVFALFEKSNLCKRLRVKYTLHVRKYMSMADSQVSL